MYQFDINFGREVRNVIDVFDALDAFDAKLIIFQNNMRVDVVKSSNLFCNFCKTMIHNMCTIYSPLCLILGLSL
jgi:hypothetical protein